MNDNQINTRKICTLYRVRLIKEGYQDTWGAWYKVLYYIIYYIISIYILSSYIIYSIVLFCTKTVNFVPKTIKNNEKQRKIVKNSEFLYRQYCHN